MTTSMSIDSHAPKSHLHKALGDPVFATSHRALVGVNVGERSARKETARSSKTILMARGAIHPNSVLRVCWDVLSLLSLAFVVFLAPVQVAHGYEDYYKPFKMYLISAHIFFALDILLNFFTGFWSERWRRKAARRSIHRKDSMFGIFSSLSRSESALARIQNIESVQKKKTGDRASRIPSQSLISYGQKIVLDLRQIRWRYLSGYFFMDVSEAVIGFTLDLLELRGALAPLHLLKAGYSLRLRPLVGRLNKLSAVQMGNMFVMSGDMLLGSRVAGIVLSFLITIHYVGCLFVFVGVASDGWTTQTAEEHIEGEFSDRWYRLLNGIYWAGSTGTTVGYGDIVPVNSWEKSYSIVVLLLATFMNALVTASISVLLHSFDVRTKEQFHRITILRSFLRHYGAKTSSTLQNRLFRYLDHVSSETHFAKLDLILKLFPKRMQTELKMALCDDMIVNCDLFIGADDTLRRAVVKAMEPQSCLAGEFVIRTGDIGSCMYFLHEGAMNIEVQGMGVVKTLLPGYYFGEIALFIESSRRTADIVALVDCSYFVLHKRDLDIILASFPEFQAQLLEVAHRRFSNTSDKLERRKRASVPSLKGAQTDQQHESRQSSEASTVRDPKLKYSKPSSKSRRASHDDTREEPNSFQKSVSLRQDGEFDDEKMTQHAPNLSSMSLEQLNMLVLKCAKELVERSSDIEEQGGNANLYPPGMQSNDRSKNTSAER